MITKDHKGEGEIHQKITVDHDHKGRGVGGVQKEGAQKGNISSIISYQWVVHEVITS